MPVKAGVSMVVNRRDLIARIDRRMGELNHAFEGALARGDAHGAGQIQKQTAELQWVIDTIDEMEA